MLLYDIKDFYKIATFTIYSSRPEHLKSAILKWVVVSQHKECKKMSLATSLWPTAKSALQGLKLPPKHKKANLKQLKPKAQQFASLQKRKKKSPPSKL